MRMCLRVGFFSAHGEILHLGLGSQIGRFRRRDTECFRLTLSMGSGLKLSFAPALRFRIEALDQMLGNLVHCFLVAFVFLVCTFDISDSVICPAYWRLPLFFLHPALLETSRILLYQEEHSSPVFSQMSHCLLLDAFLVYLSSPSVLAPSFKSPSSTAGFW